jgi:hypothetical protein
LQEHICRTCIPVAVLCHSIAEPVGAAAINAWSDVKCFGANTKQCTTLLKHVLARAAAARSNCDVPSHAIPGFSLIAPAHARHTRHRLQLQCMCADRWCPVPNKTSTGNPVIPCCTYFTVHSTVSRPGRQRASSPVTLCTPAQPPRVCTLQHFHSSPCQCLLHQLHPIHSFSLSAGQEDIALAVWALNVALFSTFLCLLLSRALCYPASAKELLEQPNQSLFFGCLPMSISVITGGVATLLVPR